MSQLQSVIDYTQKNTKLSGDLKRHQIRLPTDAKKPGKSQENWYEKMQKIRTDMMITAMSGNLFWIPDA